MTGIKRAFLITNVVIGILNDNDGSGADDNNEKHRYVHAYNGPLFFILSPPLSAPPSSLRPCPFGTSTSYSHLSAGVMLQLTLITSHRMALYVLRWLQAMKNQQHSVAEVQIDFDFESCQWLRTFLSPQGRSRPKTKAVAKKYTIQLKLSLTWKLTLRLKTCDQDCIQQHVRLVQLCRRSGSAMQSFSGCFTGFCAGRTH